MASTKVIMPQMGESVAEGTVAKWLKSIGDEVDNDENILEISTDKIDVEVPSPQKGFLRKILVDEGETVEVGTPIAIISDTADEKVEGVEDAPAPEKAEAEDKPAEKSEPAETKKEEKKERPITAGEERGKGDKRKFYTPVVLRMAAEHDLDLDQIEGTGLGGRVTKKDVQKYLDEGKPVSKPVKEKKEETKAPSAPAFKPVSYDHGENVEIIEMNNVRKKTAEHMVRSKHTSPHVHSTQEVDMTRIVKWRDSVKKKFKEENGYSLSYMAIVSKVVCDVMKDFPLINSSVDGDKIVVKKNINIGMAVALPDETLIVPVIKNADHLNVKGLSAAITDIAYRARNKKLTVDDIQGGTFSITNYGVFGTVIGTPIISQPQVAILGTGDMKKRPVVVETDDGDTIAIRTVMNMTLGYDHRIIDGGYGGKFLAKVVEGLENFNPDNA
jgi:2-oxoglutarate dehydrogenase E2 component (dihydrolipoamide succinyltransferase)